MYKLTLSAAFSILCATAAALAQTHPSDDQTARAIRASITAALQRGQLTEQLAGKYREFRLIQNAGQFARQGETFEDVASVRILEWSPFHTAGAYWPVESCVVFAMHVYPTTSEHNLSVKMRFNVSKGDAAGPLKVEHLAPPSDSTAASIKCELHAHPYLRGRG